MRLAIKCHATRGKEVIQLLEMFGGRNSNHCAGQYINRIYFVNKNGYIESTDDAIFPLCYVTYTLKGFKEKYPYNVGNMVVHKSRLTIGLEVTRMQWDDADECVIYTLSNQAIAKADDLQPYQEESIKEDKGNISDGYHTFNELYEYRLLYNASMFNELAKQGFYDVHKSKLHSDGEYPFGDSNWFIVMAELPTGQISNHYEMKDWDLFQIPEKEKANVWDGHTPQDVANRIRKFLTPKPTYPKTFEECCYILDIDFIENDVKGYKDEQLYNLQKLLICRDAYWKLYGTRMCSKRFWEPDYDDGEDGNYFSTKFFIYCYRNKLNRGSAEMTQYTLAFPTEEIRDDFFENFKDLIEQCKEFL